jgi:hypothetical protein
MGMKVKVALRQVSFYEYLGFYPVSIIPPTCYNNISFVFHRHYMILATSASVNEARTVRCV